jgi:hypothetical protein
MTIRTVSKYEKKMNHETIFIHGRILNTVEIERVELVLCAILTFAIEYLIE